MALNKKDEFNKKERDLSELADSLSHPARLSILKTVASKSSCICGEIVNVIPLAQATVSQHLKALKNAGLIHGEVDGLKTCYCLDWENFASMKKAFIEFFESIEKHKSTDKCC